MLFNSYAYAIFLPIVFALYWLIADKYRWILLLIASYYFYMSWNPKYVVLILGTTFVSYEAARLIENTESKKKKKQYLVATAVVCMGVLFLFKYFNFFSKNFVDFVGLFSLKLHPVTLKLVLPVGISFYTFQTLSYVIDVYKGDVKAEKHFGYYATFISFFPQLVAGPIERTRNLLPQIKGEKHFDEAKAIAGLKQMGWGFFKKMAVSDMLAMYADMVFNNVYQSEGFSFVVATFFFTIQIYCDFSGYSDIAIGSAKLLGIDLMENFHFPYFAISIKEFWARWHISLTTWFRDYLYIPMGGNRCSKARRSLNVITTFLVSGLWHGANWTFVIWGLIHGCANALENLCNSALSRFRKIKIGKLISWLFVFAFCNVAWVFFRAQSLKEATYMISHVFDGIADPFSYLKGGCQRMLINKVTLPEIAKVMMVFLVGEVFMAVDRLRNLFIKLPKFIHWMVYYLFVAFTIYTILGNTTGDFIYFQF